MVNPIGSGPTALIAGCELREPCVPAARTSVRMPGLVLVCSPPTPAPPPFQFLRDCGAGAMVPTAPNFWFCMLS